MRTATLRRGTAVAAGLALMLGVVSATAAQAAAKKVNICTATNLAEAGGMNALAAAARKEGQLNLVATPRDWANYGEIMDIMTTAFGVKINSDNPDGSSAYEIQTIKTAPANKQPDIVDIGISVLPDALGIGRKTLFAPYKPVTWKDIPSEWKDVNGLWKGEYTGALALAYDASVSPAPTKISDLSNSAYKGMVALPGDPSGAQQAFMAVFAGSLANGGSADNIQPGIDFFKGLKSSGNFVNVNASEPATYASGAWKVSLFWSYNTPGLATAAQGIGKTLKFAMPKDVIVQGTPYLNAISAKAPHCAAARLWEELLYSEAKGKTHDQLTAADLKLPKAALFGKLMGGQNVWMASGAVPITSAAMVKKGTLVAAGGGLAIPKGVKVVMPSPDQQSVARPIVQAAWPTL